MRKLRPTTVSVSPGFKALLKAEAALNGKTVTDFTDELSKDEKFISEYFSENKNKGLRRKNGFGFNF